MRRNPGFGQSEGAGTRRPPPPPRERARPRRGYVIDWSLVSLSFGEPGSSDPFLGPLKYLISFGSFRMEGSVPCLRAAPPPFQILQERPKLLVIN